QQVRATEQQPHSARLEAIYRFAVELLGSVALADQGTAACLDTQRPIGLARASRLGQLLESVCRGTRVIGSHGGLDELGHTPVPECEVALVGSRRPRRFEGLAIPSEAVEQDRSRAVGDSHSLALPTIGDLADACVDQRCGLLLSTL